MTQERLHVWEDIIDDEIREIYANYGERSDLGQRPVLLCIDNYNMVFGDGPEPVLKAIKRFPSSCGLVAWEAIEPTQRLMAAARGANVPVIHTTIDTVSRSSNIGTAPTKRKRTDKDTDWDYTFFHELRPEESEVVIYKPRASAFYGTCLASHLTHLEANTLIICGNSTSGCVRASVVDAYSAGYDVVVVEECVFDRSWLSHKVNLFDLNSKYADVMFLEETLEYLASLSVPRRPRRQKREVF